MTKAVMILWRHPICLLYTMGCGSCRCATPSVLAAPQYPRRRLRADGGPGSASPAKHDRDLR